MTTEAFFQQYEARGYRFPARGHPPLGDEWRESGIHEMPPKPTS